MISPKQLLEVEDELTQQLNTHIESGIRNNISRGHNNASDIGFECDSYQTLCRLKGKLKPRHSVNLEKIFRVGREWERPNIRWLQDAEIKVRQTTDKRFEWNKYNIVGYMDADIIIPGIDPTIKIPLEHKTVSPSGFRAIKKCKEDGMRLTQIKQIWVRKYPGQLTAYMLFKEVDIGAWFFFEKASGDFLWWLTTLDYDYSETLIKRAERCEENVAKGFIPEPKTKEICNMCDFAKTYCYPDKDYGPGFAFLSDKEAGDKLERRATLKPSHQEYSQLDKLLKGHFRGKNVVVGNFKIETKVHSNRTEVVIERL